MSASTEIDGLKIERYYHFICKPDATTFEYLRELGIHDKLRWVDTKMGFYYDGRLHEWGNPLALLKFPGLDLFPSCATACTPLRHEGLRLARARQGGRHAVAQEVGRRARYDVLWRASSSSSSSSTRTASRRAGWARASSAWAVAQEHVQERLGYLEGGSDTLLDAIEAHPRHGRRHPPASPAREKIEIEEGAARHPRGGELRPTTRCLDDPAAVPREAGARPARAERDKVGAIVNIGVVCAIFKLKHPISPNFWTNINDPCDRDPGPDRVLQPEPAALHDRVRPFYMPVTHPKYSCPRRPSSRR
jgi:hypothetical protein